MASELENVQLEQILFLKLALGIQDIAWFWTQTVGIGWWWGYITIFVMWLGCNWYFLWIVSSVLNCFCPKSNEEILSCRSGPPVKQRSNVNRHAELLNIKKMFQCKGYLKSNIYQAKYDPWKLCFSTGFRNLASKFCQEKLFCWIHTKPSISREKFSSFPHIFISLFSWGWGDHTVSCSTMMFFTSGQIIMQLMTRTRDQSQI